MLVNVWKNSNNHVEKKDSTDHNVNFINDPSKHNSPTWEIIKRKVSKACIKQSWKRGRVISKLWIFIVKETTKDKWATKEKSSKYDHKVCNDFHHHEDHSNIHSERFCNHNERPYFKPNQKSHANIKS